MYRDDARPNPRNTLYLVAKRGPNSQGMTKGAPNMNAYKFANLPSNSSVDSGVTMLVSFWFLVAATAILGDPASVYTKPAPLGVAAVTQAAPDTRETIVVEASRATSVALAPQARETIVVQASRSATL